MGYHPLTVARPAQWVWMGKVWKQRALYCIVLYCIVCLFVCVVFVLYHFFQPALLISFICCCASLLLQAIWRRRLRTDQLSILCLHHFICPIEPSLLNLPSFLCCILFLPPQVSQLVTAHHALQPTPLWNEANFPSGFDVKLRNVRKDDKSS